MVYIYKSISYGIGCCFFNTNNTKLDQFHKAKQMFSWWLAMARKKSAIWQLRDHWEEKGKKYPIPNSLAYIYNSCLNQSWQWVFQSGFNVRTPVSYGIRYSWWSKDQKETLLEQRSHQTNESKNPRIVSCRSSTRKRELVTFVGSCWFFGSVV